MVSQQEIEHDRKEINAAYEKAQKRKDNLGFRAGKIAWDMQHA